MDHYDESSVEAKHMVIARLIDRIEVGKGYEVHIRMKMVMAQLIEKTAYSGWTETKACSYRW